MTDSLIVPEPPMKFPQYDKTEKWQIRVHRSYDELDNCFVKYRYDSDKAFGFQHDADEEVSRTHCHLYFFGLKKKKQTIHEFFASRFKGNQEFSISQTCGRDKRELDIVGAWCYGTTEKLLEPRFTHNLKDDEIAYLKEYAAEFWQKIKVAREKKITKFEILEIVIEKEKKDNIFASYLERVWGNPDCINWGIGDFKKWIIADYLSQCKPAPRLMDLNRYAYSLYMLRDPKKEKITRDEIRTVEY